MKNMKGITLIALVITIVVLIILAGVAISLSVGENGIFEKAKLAKEEYKNAEVYEQEQIAKTLNEIDGYIGNSREISEEDLNSMFFPNKEIILTIENEQVTIPRNGWLYINFNKSTPGATYYAKQNNFEVFRIACWSEESQSGYIPVKKGDIITVEDNSETVVASDYFELSLRYYEK